jgi:hypothetical protein
MQLKEIDNALRGKLQAQAAAEKPARRSLMPRLFGRRAAVAPGLTPQSRDRRGDLVIAGLGIALGLGCALFPWYIFFNQDKFGIRALKFEGQGERETGPIYLGSQPDRVGAPMTVEDIPPMKLDLFATGTLPENDGVSGGVPGLSEQPFPPEIAAFRLVHVANGRAMIEDDTGLWVVQRGSRLPDNSRVAGIEQRDGKWVLVTSAAKVIELSK